MTTVSARRLAANRANAQASTGPRTAAGKARASGNAVRHGLSSQRWRSPETGRAIERWGRKLAGETTGEARELAYGIAAAQVELERVGEARRKLYARPAVAAAITTGLPAPPPSTPEAADVDFGVLEETLSEAVWELDALQRYEGRAFARRQRAIAALDALRAGEAPPRRRRRPAGIRLPRWRLPNPFSRVIKFEGLPRWAWWRPDPLDEPPRRPRRRKRGREAPGELEILLRPEVLLRMPTLIPEPETLHLRETKPPPDPAPTAAAGEPRRSDPPDAGAPPSAPYADRLDAAQEPPTPTPASADRAAVVVSAPDVETLHLRKTNPISDPAINAGGPDPASGAAGTPAEPQARAPDAAALPDPAPATTPAPSQAGVPKPWRRGATPTPLPTCRVGPCRWEGEIPAHHWSYRGSRYKRTPARGPPWRLA